MHCQEVTRMAPKVMPSILLCWRTTSEADIGGKAVELSCDFRTLALWLIFCTELSALSRSYKNGSENNAFYFVMLTYNVRGRYWGKASRVWTSPSITRDFIALVWFICFTVYKNRMGYLIPKFNSFVNVWLQSNILFLIFHCGYF